MKLNTDLALKNLIDLDKIFKSHKAPCWLQDGTLLGYYRENNFISHDLDTDMGMMFDDFSIEILEDTKKMGFEHSFLGYPDSCFEITFKRFDVRTDLFFYYQKEDFIYHSAFLEINRIDYHYKKFSLKEANFLGHNFIVPSNELKFITTKYGDSWEIPDKNWSYAYSPKNHFKHTMLLDWEEQNIQVEKWLNCPIVKTKKVITYGTFDTFHYGHLEILRRAKNLGDYLIVGLSTDEFNILKGKESKFKYEKRKEWLESIKFIDLIIPEEEWEQKENDIQKYKVDIFVMGDDWQGKFDDLPCSVTYLKRTDNISSTEIKKII